MRKRFWKVNDKIGLWIVQYDSTASANVVDTVYQYLINDREVGHITVHKNRQTGEVIIHRYGITEGWEPPNPNV